MQKELKEKLEKLGEKYSKDIELLSLKALCTVPESEEILSRISQLLEKISKKYPEDEEILKLLPNKEISIEELIEILEKDYSGNIDFITLKAMLSLAELPEIEREKAIKIYLRKINNKDENIKKYLDSKIINNPLMVFVEGGEWEKTEPKKCTLDTINLEVSKYQVTQGLWQEIMGSLERNILMSSIGKFKPIEGISWWEALNFCNKLSEKYGLEPVYVIEDDDNFYKLKIKYLSGEIIPADKADFSKTEGFRLPTEVEWEWFARGGLKGLEDKTFRCTYSGSNRIDEVAWYESNAGKTVRDVGGKKPNSLGIFDCSGNVWEWCFDSCEVGINNSNIYEEFAENKKFSYNRSHGYRQIKGGSLYHKTGSINNFNDTCQINKRESESLNGGRNIGFRVVRTANPEI